MICLFFILHEFLMNATVFAIEENYRSANFVTRVNKRLSGHVVKHFSSPSLMSCSQSCLKSSWCTSTNFKESFKQGEKGTCELNKRGNAPIKEHTELVDQRASVFSIFLKVGSRSFIRNFTQTRRRRQRKRQLTKGLISKTTALHVHGKLWYISLPS